MKTLKLEYDGKTYTLCYDLKSCKKLDAMGFRYREAYDTIATSVPLLFYGAFLCHHSYMTPEKTEKILLSLKGKQELFDRLIEMYTDALLSVSGEPETDDGKNATWGADW